MLRVSATLMMASPPSYILQLKQQHYCWTCLLMDLDILMIPKRAFYFALQDLLTVNSATPATNSTVHKELFAIAG